MQAKELEYDANAALVLDVREGEAGAGREEKEREGKGREGRRAEGRGGEGRNILIVPVCKRKWEKL